MNTSREFAEGVLEFGTVVVTVPEFCDRFDLTYEELDVLAAAAVADGLVGVVEDPHRNQQRLYLTPLAAAILKIELDGELAVWIPKGQPFTRVPWWKRHRFREWDVFSWADSRDIDGMDFWDERANEPYEIAIASEQISRFDREIRRARIDKNEPKPERPRVLINMDRPWPIVGPCCQGRDLKWGEYCAWCDRSGADSLIEVDTFAMRRSEHLRKIQDGVSDLKSVS